MTLNPFEVLLDRRAEREFAKLPPNVRRKFYGVFEALSVDPFRPRPGCDIRALEGAGKARAVRVGQFRGIYEVVGREVRLTAFARRSVVYRR